ncbi:MAG: hypothetical protein NTX20_09525 [Verrucomicrobia bacterium]|nr:hypothetical protein [Verrucomicrobiota bacterium]
MASRPALQEQGQGQQGAYDGQLANLDTDVERQQASDKSSRRQHHRLQEGGKSETMDQSETKSQHRSMTRRRGPEILQRDINDGRRNRAFHPPPRQLNDLHGRQNQSDAMGDREGGDDFEKFPGPGDHDQGGEKT